MKLKVVELFSGIGAQSKALENIGINHEIVATADWDIFSNISYAAVHHTEKLMDAVNKWDSVKRDKNQEEIEKEKLILKLNENVLSRDGKKPVTTLRSFKLRQLFILDKSLELNKSFTDIKMLKGADLPDHNTITYSFPCQDLSLQGSQKGLVNGSSSSMLWEVERILKELKKQGRLPKFLVMENVKSLFSEKYREGFEKWIKSLETMGYTNHAFELNSKFFGIPQNRERAFMVSELNQNKFKAPKPGVLTKKTIGDILSREWKEWTLPKGEIVDWNPIRNVKGLAKSKIIGYSTFQSEAAAFGKNSISPTITATGALNRIKVLEDKNKLRILNSCELWRLMGFTKQDWMKVNKLEVVPENFLKKQAGNSIVVQVLEEIFKGLS